MGGYQVCDKWLKDRRGRILSLQDITLYERIAVALAETIRLMAGVDEAIEEHLGMAANTTAALCIWKMRVHQLASAAVVLSGSGHE
jgi:hypothetical protein